MARPTRSCVGTRVALAAALLGVLLGGACVPAGGEKAACERGVDCVEGFFCADGRCVAVDGLGRCTPDVQGNDGCDAWSNCVDTAPVASDEADHRCLGTPGCTFGCGGAPCN